MATRQTGPRQQRARGGLEADGEAQRAGQHTGEHGDHEGLLREFTTGSTRASEPDGVRRESARWGSPIPPSWCVHADRNHVGILRVIPARESGL